MVRFSVIQKAILAISVERRDFMPGDGGWGVSEKCATLSLTETEREKVFGSWLRRFLSMVMRA